MLEALLRMGKRAIHVSCSDVVEWRKHLINVSAVQSEAPNPLAGKSGRTS